MHKKGTMRFYPKLYITGGVLVYCIALLMLHFQYQIPWTDFGPIVLITGGVFCTLAWLLTRKLHAPWQHPPFRYEGWLLVFLVCLIVGYITYGGTWINSLFPKSWTENPRINDLLIFVRKLFFFVALPYLLYRNKGFTTRDFGLSKPAMSLRSPRAILILLLFSTGAIAFQLLFGAQANNFRHYAFSSASFFWELPLCFLYLLLDVGLIEEFFFRGLLQSRISALLQSPSGSIIISSLIFGLVHAPGLYLRGAGSEGIEEPLPFPFFAFYTIVFMSMAGLLMGMLYRNTKNLWLVMIIHAMIDLVPNFTAFHATWHP